MRVAGKCVVVTGGATGIGRALAERFAAEGARGVVVADINTEWAAKVAERIGNRGLGVGCDVSDPDAISRLVSTAEGSFGGGRAAQRRRAGARNGRRGGTRSAGRLQGAESR